MISQEGRDRKEKYVFDFIGKEKHFHQRGNRLVNPLKAQIDDSSGGPMFPKH